MNGSVAESTPSLCPPRPDEEATAPADSPPAGFEPGSECDGFCSVVVVVVVVVVVAVVVVVVTTGGAPGSGCGCGCGCGVDPPQLPARWLLSACTSTSCRPEHGASLCGWLLPGPWSTAFPAAPFCSAICPAVCPLPYCFVLSDCASACVSCAVLFDGLTPVAFVADAVVVGVMVVVAALVVVSAAGGGASFFTCPGAVAAFPGASP